MRSTLLRILASLLWLPATARAENRGEPVTFAWHGWPMLNAMCWECHGDKAKPKGGLDLRLVRFMNEGGDSGPAVAAGKAKESLLLQRVVSEEMPPGKKK